MSTRINNYENEKKGGTNTLCSKLLTASAASAFIWMAYTPAAHAQRTVIDVTACGDFADNPGVNDLGAIVNIDIDGTCTVSSGDNLELEDGDQDDVRIVVNAGTTLINTDTDDENVVIFVDNAENNTSLLIEAGATLQGQNGVIFLEGDRAIIRNLGDIIGVDAQEEGVIYIDRDTDSDTNIIRNEASGRIISQSNGPAIGIEVGIADGFAAAEDVGVQNDLSDFPTVRINNLGLIEVTGTSSDDNDAINIAGNPGTSNGINRPCLEGAAENCILNLNLTNSGIIRSNFDNSGSAAITIEDDAIVVGRINNQAAGLITGTRNGIRIGDIVEDGATAEQSLLITNFGSISGTGASSRGIDLEGDGVTIINGAGGEISGLSIGIEVGAGTSGGVTNSGVNNVIHNTGTISGNNFSIDSNSAEGRVRVIVREGAIFEGDIRGSVANTDQLLFRDGASSLEVDVLQNYNIFVHDTANVTFVGDRLLEGRLQSAGTATFDVADTLTVTGDVILRAGSTVAVTDLTSIGAIGDSYTLVDVGGTLTNNASLTDNSALLDFIFDNAATDLVVIAQGAPSSKTSVQFSSAAATSFGGVVLDAFSAGGLDNTAAFSALGGLESFSAVSREIENLAPDLNGNLVQNVFNSVQGNAGLIDQRLADLDCNAIGGSDHTCSTFAETGAWIQVSDTNSTQGSLSSLSTSAFNSSTGTDSRSFTYGYDHVLEDSTVLGFSGSYTENNIDEQGDSNAFTDLEVAQLSAYAGRQVGQLSFISQASYTYAEANTRRQAFELIQNEIDVEGLNVKGTASYNANIGSGYYAKPHVGLQFSDITTSSFTENGGLNLNIDESNSSVLEGRVGLTLGARKAVSDKTRADYYVTAALRNDFAGDRGDLGFAFAGQAGSLAVTNLGAYGVQGLAGLNIYSGKNFSFGGAVNAELSQSEDSVGGSLQTRIRW